MILVLDGPNNCGKSTLISKLKEREYFKKYFVWHNTGDQENSFHYYNSIAAAEENYIWDRGPLGELVYPKLYGREQNITLSEFERFLERPDVVYVFVYQPKDAIKKNYILAGESDSEEFSDDFIDREFELFSAAVVTYGDSKHLFICRNQFEHSDYILDEIERRVKERADLDE